MIGRVRRVSFALFISLLALRSVLRARLMAMAILFRVVISVAPTLINNMLSRGKGKT